MATATSALIARFARVYLTNRPEATTLDALKSRVDGGGITLSQQLQEFHQSADRTQGYADELATLFFLVLNRPPDLSTFTAGMNLLESGTTLERIAELGMTIRGGQLNTSQSNQQFLDQLASQMFAQPNQLLDIFFLKNILLADLDAGRMTKAQLLAAAAAYQHPSLKYKGDIDTALIALAAAGREASVAELSLYRNNDPLPVMRDLLTKAGESAYGDRPYFSVDANASGGSKLMVSGYIKGDFTLNLSRKTSVITDTDSVSNYSLVYSPDAGVSESIIKLNASLLSNFATVDLSALKTKDLKSVTFDAHDSGVKYIGADIPNTITGGAGSDTLIGGTAADTFYGSAGADTLTGGAGVDTFVLAPAATYRASSANITSISDFGNGSDKLSLNRLFGKLTAATNATLIQADAAKAADATQLAALNLLAANGVVLVNNSGTWADASNNLQAATAANIASIFSSVSLADTTTNSKNYAVISYDMVNGADVWLISNLTAVQAIDVTEIKLIGHINSYANVDLLAQLKTAGTVVV